MDKGKGNPGIGRGGLLHLRQSGPSELGWGRSTEFEWSFVQGGSMKRAKHEAKTGKT